MAKLTDEMKTMLEKQLAVVATASKQGVPNIGPKGSLHVLDDETLCYSEGTAIKTLHNLQENPQVSILVVDREKGDGYQFKGTAELATSGPSFDRVAKRQAEQKRAPPKCAVSIRINEIYSVRPGKTAQKIA